MDLNMPAGYLAISFRMVVLANHFLKKLINLSGATGVC